MSKSILVVIALSGLAGALGVVSAGLAAHGAYGPMMESGARFLTLHAVAALALAGIASTLAGRRRAIVAAAFLLLGGSLLFCTDLMARGLGGFRLFPMAAPLGATLVILGWVAASLTALVALAGRSE